MSGMITPILQWLNENPELAGLATFVISAAESVAIIGTIVPGTVTMTAIGALAGAGVIPLWSTIIWAILGAIVGDGISYWIGHYFKDRLRRMWPFKDNPGILDKGEVFVHKYGVTSIFIGRFVGPVRALVPVVAGMLGMKPLQFTIANIASAIGWAPAYMLPGILLGAASLELPPEIALHVILALFLVVLFFALCFWLLYKILQLVHLQIDQMQDAIWRFMKGSKILSPITTLLKHHDQERKHGQLNLAVYFLIFSTLFLGLAYWVKTVGADHIAVNDAAYHLFRGLRNVTLDNVMMGITLLGQKQVLYPVILIVLGYLIYAKHWREASHAIMISLFAVGSVFVFKHLLQSTRPWGIFYNPESYSMPSGHTVLATTLYVGLAFLIASSMHVKRGRWLIYTTALILAFAVGISRMYLGAHWFTDVLSGWLMGGAIICFVIISYERNEINRVNPLHIFVPSLLVLVVSYAFYYHTHIAELRINTVQQYRPIVNVEMSKWWKDDNEVPEYRTSLFGFPSQPINIQWVGDLTSIQKSLVNEGWEQPPTRDMVSMLHRIADISSTQYVPMISPQYQDKQPVLIMTKSVEGIKNKLVIRFWDSRRIMTETKKPLWVGIVSVVPRTYSWVFKKNHNNLEVQPKLIFTNTTQRSWSYKIVAIDHDDSHQKIKQQRILLIRPR
jgi:membrane protein DedA with SNARE-associated domain